MSMSKITLDGITVMDQGDKLYIEVDGYSRSIPNEYARELAYHIIALCDTGRLDQRFLKGMLSQGNLTEANDPALPAPTILDAEVL